MCLFFQNKKPKASFEEIEALINEFEEKLKSQYTQEQLLDFLNLLSRRRQDFIYMIRHSHDRGKKRAFINAYYAFALALTQSQENPSEIACFSREYFNSKDYKQVGGAKGEQAPNACDKWANYLLRLGLFSILLGFIAMHFSFPLGLVLLGTGIITFASALVFIIKYTLPKADQVREEEQNLFDNLESLFLEKDLMTRGLSQ